MSTAMVRSPSRATVLLLLTACVALAQQNEVSLDNRSGEPALVRVIGPTLRETQVSVGGTATVGVLPGKYRIKVRYGVPGSPDSTIHEV